jgi:hypothetical protein
LLGDAGEKAFAGQRLGMDVGRQVLAAADIVDEFDGRILAFEWESNDMRSSATEPNTMKRPPWQAAKALRSAMTTSAAARRPAVSRASFEGL